MKNVIALTGIGALALTLQACDNQTPPTVEGTPVAVETEAPAVEVIEPVVLLDTISTDDWRATDESVLSTTDSGALMLVMSGDQTAFLQRRNSEIVSGDTVTAAFDFTTEAPVDLQLRIINNCDQDADTEAENKRVRVEAGSHSSSLSHTFENGTECVRAYLRAQNGDASIVMSRFVLTKE